MSSSLSKARAWAGRVFARYVELQVRRPFLFIAFAALLAIPSIWLARGLELRTGFESLLPENKPSVLELDRVSARTAGTSTLAIVIDGEDKKALQQFSDALVPALRELGPEWVGRAENGVHAEQEFLRARQALFLSLDEVQRLHDRIEERYDYEVNGSLTGDEPDPITRETIEKELKGRGAGVASGPPYPDGYYMNAEGTRLVVLVRTPIALGDLDGSQELQNRVSGVIAQVKPESFHPSIRTGFAGDIVTSAETYGTIKNDLATVGAAGIAMILLVDFLFFLRLRAVLVMALAIGSGVLWTFAVTRLAIGHLNTASGFLVSIIFGNGINFGILLRARYGEARRSGVDLHDAILATYRDTFRPTLTVAAAAGAGYLSLASTSFRGFRDFGIIGGYGMLLCWAANFLLMPPLLVVFEKLAPTYQHAQRKGLWAAFQRLADNGLPFGAPFAWIARKVPPALVASTGTALAIVAAVLCVRYVATDPLEYNMRNLENDLSSVESKATRLGVGMTDITGRSGHDGMAVMTDRLDQVKPLLAELEKRRKATPDNPPFEKAISIFDLIPENQPEKIALLTAIRSRIDRVHELGKISEADWNAIQPHLPAKDLKPFGVEDLPERVARPFTEKDGSRGRIVYVVPTEGQSVRDMHYLLRWADSYRSTTLPSGEVILGSGRSVILADMLSGIIEEAPKAIALSALMTVVAVVIAFMRGVGGPTAILLVLGALATGVSWMGGLFFLGGIKLNFLNFIAIPITVGIGVDYAINMVHRWKIEGPGHVAEIVRETGGAVILCSLTTIVGYQALMHSVNSAVRSFGLAAVIGEITCLSAVVVVLPAFLSLLERRRAARNTAVAAPLVKPDMAGDSLVG